MTGKTVDEQPETPKILEEISRSNSAKPAGRQQTVARRRFIIVLLVFFILITSVAGLGYQQWLLQSRLISLDDQNQELSLTLSEQDAEIERLRANQSDVPAPLVVDDTAVTELEASFAAEVTRLRQQIASLQQQQRSVTTEINMEWKVLEAQYLLGIANQKLQLEADPVAAMALLDSADAALVDSGSSSVFAVRQAIAADKQILSSIQPIDREGIYLRLDSLVSQIDAIDLLQSLREEFEQRRLGEFDAAPSGTGSSGIVDAGLQFLGSIFVWRKWDETPVTMLAPGQENFIKQNLRLLLEQAQLALLLRDNNIYHRSLNNSLEWLGRYSAPDSSAAQNLRAAITELQKLNVNPPLPALEQTLLAINLLTAGER